jgi:hypothetical protein
MEDIYASGALCIIIDIIGSKIKPKKEKKISLVANRTSQQRWL